MERKFWIYASLQSLWPTGLNTDYDCFLCKRTNDVLNSSFPLFKCNKNYFYNVQTTWKIHLKIFACLLLLKVKKKPFEKVDASEVFYSYLAAAERDFVPIWEEEKKSVFTEITGLTEAQQEECARSLLPDRRGLISVLFEWNNLNSLLLLLIWIKTEWQLIRTYAVYCSCGQVLIECVI